MAAVPGSGSSMSGHAASRLGALPAHGARAELLSPSGRARLALSAVAVLAMYVLSFELLRALRWQGILALGVLVAAALAWLLVAPLLLAVTRGHASPAAWLDACLRTAATGRSVLVAAVILNVGAVAFALPRRVIVESFPLAHGAILLAADIAMALTFVGQARGLGLPAARAAALWTLGFNGILTLSLWLSGLLELIARRF